jgi:hypothetical protein
LKVGVYHTFSIAKARRELGYDPHPSKTIPAMHRAALSLVEAEERKQQRRRKQLKKDGKLGVRWGLLKGTSSLAWVSSVAVVCVGFVGVLLAPRLSNSPG